MAREETLRQYFLRTVRKAGGRVYKLSPVGRRGKPDELVLMPWGRKLLVELKKKGKKPEPHQAREFKRLKRLGHDVRVIDSKSKVDFWI
jgi:hypothetical protein